jgi:hypothetical protein
VSFRALEKVVQAEATIAIAMHDTMSRKANNGERIDQVFMLTTKDRPGHFLKLNL